MLTQYGNLKKSRSARYVRRNDTAKKTGAAVSAAKKAAEYIDLHYTEKFSLDRIAAALFLNKIYLSKCFKQATGSTLLQYHNRVRCENACELLTGTDLSVEIVSDRVGFATASHFSRVFRSFYGCSPSEYRRR